MRRDWIAILLATVLSGGAALAADHRDGPAVDMDPTVDITDVYAWMSSDGSKAYLVMDVQGANTGATASTKWSNSALYVFHLASTAAFGTATTNPVTIICQFDAQATQGFQCWGPGGEYVADATGNTTGKASASGKMKVAALVRDDPFPFNIRGFLATAGAVHNAAGLLTFDAAGCPTVSSQTSAQLVGALKSDGAGGAGSDDFGKNGKAAVACSTGTCDAAAVTNGNVLSIVIAIDKTLLTGGGKIVTVWGSTNKAM